MDRRYSNFSRSDISWPTWINSGSLGSGSVSEISSRHSFFVKVAMCSYEKPDWLGYGDLGFRDGDLGNRDENFPI